MLPIHFAPLPGELLSSWLARLASAHGLAARALSTVLWPGRSLFAADIDNCASDRLVTEIAALTGVDLESVRRTCLASLQGVLFERHHARGYTQWVLPLGCYHQPRRRHGLQFCAECLDEDSRPYFRLRWRLAGSAVCARHGRVLEDACPACGAPVDFVGRGTNPQGVTARDAGLHCRSCGVDYRRAAKSPAVDRELETQRLLDRVLDGAHPFLPSCGSISPLSFFRALRQLLRVISTDADGARLRHHISLAYLGRERKIEQRGGHSSFESLRVRDRAYLLQLALPLLANWPHDLIAFARAAHVYRERLLRDFSRPPTWYRQPIRQYLWVPAWPKGREFPWPIPQRREAPTPSADGCTLALHGPRSPRSACVLSVPFLGHDAET